MDISVGEYEAGDDININGKGYAVGIGSMREMQGVGWKINEWYKIFYEDSAECH